MYLHPAAPYRRLTPRLSQEQKGLDERAHMASQWPSPPWGCLRRLTTPIGATLLTVSSGDARRWSLCAARTPPKMSDETTASRGPTAASHQLAGDPCAPADSVGHTPDARRRGAAGHERVGADRAGAHGPQALEDSPRLLCPLWGSSRVCGALGKRPCLRYTAPRGVCWGTGTSTPGCTTPGATR